MSPCGACGPFREVLVEEEGQHPGAGSPACDPGSLCTERAGQPPLLEQPAQASSFRPMSWRFSREERCPFRSIAGLPGEGNGDSTAPVTQA